MTFLLDTNVLSELRKPRGNPGVRAWIAGVADADLYTSVLVVGEIRRGIEGLRPRDPAQAAVYEAWLSDLRRHFAARLLPITGAVAEEWGRMNVRHTVPVIDGLLAATARVGGLTLVTRNTADVERTGVPVLNPFDASAV